jgi:hypothetical protein
LNKSIPNRFFSFLYFLHSDDIYESCGVICSHAHMHIWLHWLLEHPCPVRHREALFFRWTVFLKACFISPFPLIQFQNWTSRKGLTYIMAWHCITKQYVTNDSNDGHL